MSATRHRDARLRKQPSARAPRKSAKHPNEGRSLDAFLAEDGNLEAATLVAIKRVVAWQLEQAMTKAKLSKVQMASRMKTSRAQLDRVLNPDDDNVTLGTLQRAAHAVGRTLRLELA